MSFSKIFDHIIAVVFVLFLCVILFFTPALLTWIFNTGLAGYLMFLFLIFAALVFHSIIFGRQSVNWLSVESTITENTLTELQQNRATLHIKYLYKVYNTEYTNTTIRIGKGVRHISDAKELSSKYPLHSRVTVFYNPNNPKNATIEKGYQGDSIMPVLLLIGAGISAFFVFNNWSGIHPERFSIISDILKIK
jgi:hypothetical protein